jgi:DNA-binding CsgD family transcriptional regulator
MVANTAEQSPLVHALLDRARAGSSLPVLFSGGHGLGKTEQLARLRAAAADMVVVDGAAVATDTGVPYAAMRSLTHSAELAARGVVDASIFRALGSGHSEEATDRLSAREVLNAIEGFFVDLGAIGPTLLTFDDLHHADRESREALLHLVSHLRHTRVIVALASAGEPLIDPHTTAAVERMRRASSIERVDLAPLDARGVQELLAARLGAEPGKGLVQHIIRATAGVPLYVLELADALAWSGALSNRGSTIGLLDSRPVPLAAAARRIVLGGVLALGDDAFQLAVIASACVPVTLDDVEAMAGWAGLTPERGDTAFDLLVAAGVLTRIRERFQFQVPLIEEALFAELGPVRSARLARHREANGGPLPSVAVDAAVIGDWVDALDDDVTVIDVIVAEGDTRRASEPMSAVEMYRRALELQDRANVDDPYLRLKLGRALLFAARHCEAAEIAGELLESDDCAIRVEASELAVDALRCANRQSEATAVLDVALRDAAVCSPRLLLDRAELSFWCDEMRVARRHLAAARAAGLGSLEIVADALEREIDLAGGAATPATFDTLARRRASASVQSRLAKFSFAAGAVHDEAATDWGGTVELVVPSDVQSAHQAWVAYRHGAWDDAEQLARDALSPADLFGEAPNPTAVGVTAALLAERGSFSRADATIAQCEGVRFERLVVDWARALLALHRGEDAAALRYCVERVARLREVGRVADSTLFLPLLAHAAVRRRDLQLALDAERLLRELDQLRASTVGHVHTLLTTARVLGDAASAAAAQAESEAAGLRLEAATALGVHGIVARDAAILTEAHRQLGELGAVARQREVTRYLRRLGRRVPGRRAGVNELSSTEAEIASLVGMGLTNRQIAQQTGLSIKTVETYLSRVFVKTGSRSRTELAIYVNARQPGQ